MQLPYTPAIAISEAVTTRRMSFLICGAQKSGTSALHDYLRRHPGIDLPVVKELHIFDNESSDWSDAGIDRIDQATAGHFQTTEPGRCCGEATPVSLWWVPAMERIWRYNPSMRLIAILRNPISRAYANWRMEQLKGRDQGPLPLSWPEEEHRCREALPLQHRVRSYLSRGLYSEQIRRVWRYFPREQLLLLRQEELMAQPAATLARVHAHLGVDPVPFEGAQSVISWRSVPDQPPDRALPQPETIPTDAPAAVHDALQRLYAPEIATLEAMLGWDLRPWLTPTDP